MNHEVGRAVDQSINKQSIPTRDVVGHKNEWAICRNQLAVFHFDFFEMHSQNDGIDCAPKCVHQPVLAVSNLVHNSSRGSSVFVSSCHQITAAALCIMSERNSLPTVCSSGKMPFGLRFRG